MNDPPQRRSDDFQLVQQTLAGSNKAFKKIVEQHQPLVYSVVRAVLGGMSSDLDDVVQEVFIKVYRGLPSFREEAKLGTWIYRIARNEAINAVSKRKIDGQPIDEMNLATPEDTHPDEQFRKEESARYLDRHLARLDETYRTVLEMRYLGEMSYAEISESLDTPIGTVKAQIHRAKHELKRLMTTKRDVRK